VAVHRRALIDRHALAPDPGYASRQRDPPKELCGQPATPIAAFGRRDLFTLDRSG